MKKIICIAIIAILSCGVISVFAADSTTEITTVIPETHTISLNFNELEGSVLLNDSNEPLKLISLARLTDVEIKIIPKSDFKIKLVMYNDSDFTDKVIDGKLILPKIYENGMLDIAFMKKDVESSSEQSSSESSISDVPNITSSTETNVSSKDNNTSTVETGERVNVFNFFLIGVATLILLSIITIRRKKRSKQ